MFPMLRLAAGLVVGDSEPVLGAASPARAPVTITFEGVWVGEWPAGRGRKRPAHILWAGPAGLMVVRSVWGNRVVRELPSCAIAARGRVRSG